MLAAADPSLVHTTYRTGPARTDPPSSSRVGVEKQVGQPHTNKLRPNQTHIVKLWIDFLVEIATKSHWGFDGRVVLSDRCCI